MSFRSAREKANISVAQATKLFNVSDAAIYQWETGVTKPTAKRLPEIAKAYGCTIDELMKEDDA